MQIRLQGAVILHKICHPKVPFSASQVESFAIFPGSLPWLILLSHDYAPPRQTWTYVSYTWQNNFILTILLCTHFQVHLVCQSPPEYQALKISIKCRCAEFSFFNLHCICLSKPGAMSAIFFYFWGLIYRVKCLALRREEWVERVLLSEYRCLISKEKNPD